MFDMYFFYSSLQHFNVESIFRSSFFLRRCFMKIAKDHCKCEALNFSINLSKRGQVVLNRMLFNTSWRRSIRPRRSVINFFLSRSTKWSRLRFAALLFEKTIAKTSRVVKKKAKSGMLSERKYSCTMNTTQTRLWWLARCCRDDVYALFSFWMSERYHRISLYADSLAGESNYSVM